MNNAGFGKEGGRISHRRNQGNAPIKFEIADDLSYWSAEIPGKIAAKAEALTGPMTPPDKEFKLSMHLEARLVQEQLQHGERL